MIELARRALLKGAALMTGDGLARPLNAPAGPQPVPGIQPGSPSVINANRVIISGPNGGLFIYSGRPAFNNLIESTTGAAGTDPYGNVYFDGTTLYHHNIVNGNYYIAVNINGLATNQNGIIFYTAASEAGPWVAQANLGNDNAGNLLLGAAANIIAGAGVVTFDPATGNTPESWHSITPDAGWTVASSFRVKLLAEKNAAWLYGDLTHAAITAATNMNSTNPLGAAYRPAGTVNVASPLYPAGRCGVEITAAGVIIAEPLGVSCTGVNINGIYPLD